MAALVSFVAVEQPFRLPLALLEATFPGAFNSHVAAVVGGREGDGDSAAGDQPRIRKGRLSTISCRAAPSMRTCGIGRTS